MDWAIINKLLKKILPLMDDAPTNFYQKDSSETAQVIMHYEEAPTMKSITTITLAWDPLLRPQYIQKHWTTDNH